MKFTNISQRDAIPLLRNINYLPVCVAGFGYNGDVFFCLQDSAALSDRTTSMDFDKLRSEIVAVKVPSTANGKDYTANEVHIMKEIHKKIPLNLQRRFSTISKHAEIESTDGVETCNWLTMPPIHSITIEDLSSYFMDNRFPKELIAHLISQISEGLFFLHDELKKAHGDLHARNVLIDFEVRKGMRLPELVIIDFGKANDIGETSFREDIRTFCTMILWFMDINDEIGKEFSEDEEWAELKNAMKRGTSWELESRDLTLSDIFSPEVRKFLARTVEGATEETIQEIRKILDLVAERHRVLVTDDDLLEAMTENWV